MKSKKAEPYTSSDVMYVVVSKKTGKFLSSGAGWRCSTIKNA